MYIRQPLNKDVPFILEWMKDCETNKFFRFDPDKVTQESVAKFVELAQKDKVNKHFVCADESDEYLGTISLKNIDDVNKDAEYAVSFRAKARGTGAARFATGEILKYAFQDLQLKKVYLEVFADNLRAMRFYEKCGFVKDDKVEKQLLVNKIPKKLLYYAIFRGEDK